MQKKLLIFIVLIISVGYIYGQEVTFQTSVPSSVVKGEQFRLTYVLRNGNGQEGKFPTEIPGVDILYGPSVSQSHRTQVINGKSSSESSESYTFVLMANQEGVYTIPSASIKVNGKTYNSGVAKVRVLPPDKASQSQPHTVGTSSAQRINPSDAFIRAIVTKTSVHEQEAFLISFRFYTTLQVVNIGKIEFPEFEGFMVEDIDLPANRELKLEHYNGRNYLAVDLKKSILFPQRSGKITIPTGKIEMVFKVPSGRKVQTLFGPQDVEVEAKRTMTTAAQSIDIKPLPEGKPASYANAVGTFTMDANISETKVKANEAITLTLTISGVGNQKLIKNPELKLPKDFEAYDPKVTNNLRITNEGLSGTRTIEYLFIPRHHGSYKISPLEFSYFDPKSKTYKTLKTPEYSLKVDKDPNAGSNTGVSYTNQNEIDVVQDIRFLKTGDFSYLKINEFLVGSTGYLLWYIIPVIIFIICFIIYRNKIKQNSNIALMKTKKANKMAIKRLKIAETHLKAHNKEKFYEEVLRAIWGYLSDKLTIPVANLNRENIEQELSNSGVSSELISTFINILDTCEFARYAPAESDDAMDKLYQQTLDAISEMDSVIKKKK